MVCRHWPPSFPDQANPCDRGGFTVGRVFLYQLVEILLQAVLRAVLHAAPEWLGQNLWRGLKTSLERVLDYEALQLDVGQGLTEVGRFTAWGIFKLSNLTKTLGTGIADQLEHSTERIHESIEGQGSHKGNDRASAWGNNTATLGRLVAGQIDRATEKAHHALDEFGRNVTKAFGRIGHALAARGTLRRQSGTTAESGG